MQEENNNNKVIDKLKNDGNESMNENYISIDDFAKIEIKLGTVMEVKEVEGSDKLYQLTVALGEERPRNVMSGIRKYKSPNDLLGKQFPFITNLAPRTMMGKYVSEAMILAASDEDDNFTLLPSEKHLKNGTKLR